MKKLSEMLPNILGTSPVTSLLGYLVSILFAIQPIITDGSFNLKKDWFNLVIAVAIALGFRNAKDTNGVTAQQGLAMKNAIIGTAASQEPIVETKAANTIIPASATPYTVSNAIHTDPIIPIATEPAAQIPPVVQTQAPAELKPQIEIAKPKGIVVQLNLTLILVLAGLLLFVFFLGKCNSYKNDDLVTERLKNQSKIVDSIRFSKRDSVVKDSILIEKLLNYASNANKETRIISQEGQIEIEKARAINKKIHEQINDSSLTDAERIDMLRFLLSKSKTKGSTDPR
jgi:hypothetical protein